MTSIRDVAKSAGVSTSTVSHVINKTRFVSEETQAKVRDAMKALGYKPNRLASSLRRKDKSTNTLGLLIPDSTNLFFAEVLRGVEDACFEAGYSVFLCNSDDDPQKELDYIEVLLGKQIDGIILVSVGIHKESLTLLADNDIPSVLVDREVSGSINDSVVVDNEAGGHQATEHLIELGHTRIGCIAGPSLLTPSAARVQGYRKALSKYNLVQDDALIIKGDFRAQTGFEATKDLLKIDNPPTAIFACNDMMAVGGLHAVDEAGLSVPKDISIVGFDDIPLASFTLPPLTTIYQPSQEMGSLAAKMVMERIKKPNLPTRKEVLPTSLITRKSCRALDEK